MRSRPTAVSPRDAGEKRRPEAFFGQTFVAELEGAQFAVGELQLFCFDPRRMAILLLGGDKSQDAMWNAWYRTAVPEADRLYDIYLAELREEGLLP